MKRTLPPRQLHSRTGRRPSCHRRRWFSPSAGIPALVIVLVLALACGSREKSVAKVGGESIGVSKYRAYVEDHPPQSVGKDASLSDLVRREVAWTLAKERGLLDGPEWREKEESVRQGVLAQAYLDTRPGPASFTEDDAREFFKAHNEERHVLHVLLASQQEAELVLARLKRGERIQDLAPKLSKDPSAVVNRGDLGWIKRGQTVRPFEEAAFGAKKGEIVGPIKTDYGWHVLLVEDLRQPSDQEFEGVKGAVLKQMNGMREEASRAKILEPLKARYPLEVDKAVLAMDYTTVPKPGDESRIAGRVAGEAISLLQLKTFMAQSVGALGESHSLGPEMKGRFLEMMAGDARLCAAAVAAGLDKQPAVEAKVWDAQHDAAYEVFQTAYLKGLQVSDADLARYREAHLSDFLGPGQVKLDLLVVDQEGTGKKAASEAHEGTPWQALYDKYANKESTGNWDMGWAEIADLAKVLPPEAVKLMNERPLGSVIGPVKGPEGYEVFRLVDRKPGPPMPLDACRGEVRDKYIQNAGESLVSAYLDGDGRKDVPIRLYPENVRGQLGG